MEFLRDYGKGIGWESFEGADTSSTLKNVLLFDGHWRIDDDELDPLVFLAWTNALEQFLDRKCHQYLHPSLTEDYMRDIENMRERYNLPNCARFI